MRHRLEGRKLGREADHRKALINNLVKSLIKHEKIKTTHSKAMEAKRLAERIVTYGKKGQVHHRRLVFKFINDRSLVKKIFDEIAPRYNERNGGYTRVIKLGYRKGDCAPISLLEWVKDEKEAKKKED